MTAIPFAQKAWPIVTGCSRHGAGCRECYASRLAATRLKHHRHYKGLAEYRDGRGHWIAPPRFNDDILTDPLRWRKARRVFVAHTGDLFHKSITQSQIFSVWKVMLAAKQHTFMVFTKRWARARQILQEWSSGGEHLADNVHIVFSASTQAEVDECAPILLNTPAARRGLSLEPLLENVDLPGALADGHEPDLDFLIAGGETSLRKSLARPCPVDAARSLKEQCLMFGIKLWWKGWGAHLPGGQIKGLLDGVGYEEYPA